MGNVHSIVGLAPCLSAEGAIIPVRREAEVAFTERLRSVPPPSYVSTARQLPSIRINNPNVFGNDVPDRDRAAYYLVIEGGGKWGYDDEFREYLANTAPMLEDARFLLSDEYTGYVDAFEIRDGALVVERLVAEQSEALEHARELLADDPEARFEIDRQVAQQWIREASAAHALPYLERALRHRPLDAALLRERGYCLSAMGRHEQAVASLEASLAALPAHTLRTWGKDDALLEVTNDVAEEVAAALKLTHERLGFALFGLGRLEDARASFIRSHSITPTRGAVGALDNLCVVSMKLGHLDEAEAGIAELLRTASSRHAIARAYYHRACLRARRGQLDDAVRDVSVALELQPRWREDIGADDELEPLQGREDFAVLIAPPR
ncbi:TPR end-of-group domain-containing protein [Paraliomyxa miuraensis]|uniref:TPR end-of-group domain-containing protein n=1 Tax=Paraliomyxa miuraensis TaxID=376150 RepID=UPI0022569E44|nr:tetratricopeptide repeat protein [Paraliomyxa miuraensis]MCX4243721.1 tetratricopeptide repeat protein [Paraliomyxa miuraensis]